MRELIHECGHHSLSIFTTMMDLELLEKKVHERMAGESTGHDIHHVQRVRRVARKIARMEGFSDVEICETIALLHDIPDRKLHTDPAQGMREVAQWLAEAQATEVEIQQVLVAIEQISYRGAHVETPMTSMAGKIVQDADRLDALGAIGIARCFAYGGSKERPIYDPSETPQLHDSAEKYYSAQGSSLAHFYEKLLLLRDRMQTESGRKLANSRHDFLEKFLQQFFMEWEGEDPV